MARTRAKVQSMMRPVGAAVDAGPPSVATELLAWYDRHRRDLPWRAKPGALSDPYAVWLSEIMLQQTTVAAVRPYYLTFLQRWPTVVALAAAPLDQILQAWAGLGYYSRARNLHACARAVVDMHGGHFPSSEAELRALPGIGAYTGAAIAAIAFGRRAVVVDGNVERVMARLFAIATPLPAARPAVREAMDAVTPEARAGDFAQAVMDLGATICTPRSPACIVCPLARRCAALKTGAPEALPRKVARRPVPVRKGAVFYVERDTSVLIRNRPATGLFGGMAELPSTVWTEDFDLAACELPPGVAGPLTRIGAIEHGLTHFTLMLEVFRAEAADRQPEGHRWVEAGAVDAEALPTLMRKVLALARNPRSASSGKPTGATASDTGVVTPKNQSPIPELSPRLDQSATVRFRRHRTS